MMGTGIYVHMASRNIFLYMFSVVVVMGFERRYLHDPVKSILHHRFLLYLLRVRQLDLFIQQFLLGLEIGVDGISMHAVGCHGLVVDLLREIDWLVAYNLGKKKKLKEFKCE